MLRKYKILYMFILLLGSLWDIHAQNTYQLSSEIKTLKNGDTLQYPFTGGFNNPQFSSIDLNNDNKKDIFIFDRAGEKILTFLNRSSVGSIEYEFAPEYTQAFPRMQHWALLVDYNCDGIEDIFTANENFIRVFKGNKTGGNLSFSKVADTLFYTINSIKEPISVLPIDIPAFIDVTGDGDIDVVTFAPGGGYMYYFENRSVENGAGCTQLEFVRADDCWGHFYESGLAKKVDLDSCGPGFTGGGGSEKLRHAGSTVLVLDENGDGLKDLVLGDISFDNLNLLINGNTNAASIIVAQDTAFPSSSPVEMPIFPAAYFVDVNNDGKRDLIISPNAVNNSIDINNIWYYENIGTATNPAFNLQRKDLFIKNTIDVGTASNPVFFDYNGDGLLDIVIGNQSKQVSTLAQSARLTLYENIGTSSMPVFEWISDDYLGISAFNLFAIAPAFGDLDGDGDLDLLIGDFNGNVHFFENTAGAGNPAVFSGINPVWMNIDVGSFATPQIVDVDRDGRMDLIIGEKNGNLNYLRNTGTPSAPFFDATPTSDFFGKVDIRPPLSPVGYSVPYLFEPDSGAAYELLVGSSSGQIFRYTNVEGNLTGIFTKSDTLFASIEVGERATVNGGYLNGDKRPELLIGNFRGGIELYSKDLGIGFSNIPNPSGDLVIYPNPASAEIYIHFPFTKKGDLIIYENLGRVIMNTKIKNENRRVEDISHLPNGVYFIIYSSENIYIANKLIITK